MLASRLVQDLPASRTLYARLGEPGNPSFWEIFWVLCVAQLGLSGGGKPGPLSEMMHLVSQFDSTPSSRPMPAALRCAIYARVSVADTQNAGLTSLDAEIEACEHYIVLRSSAVWR